MAEAANSVELLFSTLNSVEWTKAPYRGMIARIGKEFYPNDKYPGIRTWRQIFQLRNLTMALRLKEEYDSIQTLAKKALQNSSTNASQNG